MTAAAAAMTSLVALVRYMETRAPRVDTVQLERERPHSVATRDATSQVAERAALAARDEPVLPIELTATNSEPAASDAPPQALCAPGTLELLVLENDQPVAGADVRVVGRKDGGIDRGSTDDLAALLRATTDASGAVVWSGLASDLYDAHVRHPNGAELACSVEIDSVSARERCIVRFGSGRLHGTVLGDDGELRRDSLVRLTLAQAGGAAELLASTRTDELGQFEFLHLPPGSALAIDGHPDASWLSPGRAVRVELAAGAEREIELGPVAGGGLCSGQLISVGGSRLQATIALRWRESEHDWHATTRAHADGSFELPLRPGNWSAFVAGRSGPIEVARAHVGAEDVSVEAKLPAGCISVRLVDASGSAVEGAIALQDAAGVRSEHPAPGGLAFVAGLAPGAWQVEGSAFDGAEAQLQAILADHGEPLELVLELPSMR